MICVMLAPCCLFFVTCVKVALMNIDVITFAYTFLAPHSKTHGPSGGENEIPRLEPLKRQLLLMSQGWL